MRRRAAKAVTQGSPVRDPPISKLAAMARDVAATTPANMFLSSHVIDCLPRPPRHQDHRLAGGQTDVPLTCSVCIDARVGLLLNHMRFKDTDQAGSPAGN